MGVRGETKVGSTFRFSCIFFESASKSEVLLTKLCLQSFVNSDDQLIL